MLATMLPTILPTFLESLRAVLAVGVELVGFEVLLGRWVCVAVVVEVQMSSTQTIHMEMMVQQVIILILKNSLLAIGLNLLPQHVVVSMPVVVVALSAALD